MNKLWGKATTTKLASFWDVMADDADAMAAYEISELVGEYHRLGNDLDKIASEADQRAQSDALTVRLTAGEYEALYKGFRRALMIAKRLQTLGYQDVDPDYVRKAIEHIAHYRPAKTGDGIMSVIEDRRDEPENAGMWETTPAPAPRPPAGWRQHPHKASDIRNFEKQRNRRK